MASAGHAAWDLTCTLMHSVREGDNKTGQDRGFPNKRWLGRGLRYILPDLKHFLMALTDGLRRFKFKELLKLRTDRQRCSVSAVKQEAQCRNKPPC